MIDNKNDVKVEELDENEESDIKIDQNENVSNQVEHVVDDTPKVVKHEEVHHEDSHIVESENAKEVHIDETLLSEEEHNKEVHEKVEHNEHVQKILNNNEHKEEGKKDNLLEVHIEEEAKKDKEPVEEKVEETVEHLVIENTEEEIEDNVHIKVVEQENTEEKVDSKVEDLNENIQHKPEEKVEVEEKEETPQIPKVDPEAVRSAAFLAKLEQAHKIMEEYKRLGNALNSKEPSNPTQEQQANYDKQLNEAIKYYQIGIQEGAILMGEVQYQNVNAQIVRDFVNTFKLLNSNVALAFQKLKKYKDAIIIDNNIIYYLDKFFSKSYARKLYCHIQLGETKEAIEVRSLMKQTFSEDQLKPYQEFFIMLENALNKDKPKVQEKNVEKENPSEQTQDEEKQVAKKAKPGKILSLLLGGALTAIGGMSLFWLFRNKNKFAY